MSVLSLLLLSQFTLSVTEPHVGTKDVDFLRLRTQGFEAYAENRYSEAAGLFTKAIDNFWLRRMVNTMCIEQCVKDRSLVDEVQTISVYLSTSTCVENCCQGKLGPAVLIPDPHIELIFRKNQYYDVIQACWHYSRNHTGNIEAAETFFLYNPDNVGMFNRLQDLYKMFQVENRVPPRREPHYHTQYRRGVEAYQKEQWGPCVYYLDSAIENFMRNTNLCRVQCTYQYDKTPSEHKVSTFVSAAVEIVESTGRCRAQCYEDMELRPFTSSPYLASILEYLQYCQYSLGSFQEASDTSLSYTLLHKRNPTINENVEVFSTQYGLPGNPRQDILDFLNNYKIDTALLEKSDSLQQDSEEEVLFSTATSYGARRFLSDKECKSLIYLAKEISVENDGYETHKDKDYSPYNVNEKFRGIVLSKAIELLEEGDIEAEEVQLYLSVVQAAKAHLEKKFKLLKPLYFDYIHLVHRSAIEGVENTSEFSHPIHADNCYIQPDGSCSKTPPAFTQRDWSAIVYLNSPEEGGEFVITDRTLTVTESLSPSCGDIVGFTADTYHGVKAVKKGDRYAIALWFTHDISKAQDMFLLQRKIEQAKDKTEVHLTKEEL
ncbi:hypothetical protein ACHWQZ_G004896 [Mnemiopsis leidyi]